MIQPKLNIATLNCRGLRKENNPKKRKLFIRHLRSLGYDVLLLQETHALNPHIIQELNFQFKTTSSHWTQHCGIVILNNRYSLDIIQEGIDGGRFILANIKLTGAIDNDISDCPTIVTVLNIYGRSGVHSQRSAFYSTLLSIPIVSETLLNSHHSPILLMGDFNYSYDKHRLSDGSLTSAPLSCTSLLEDRYVDCFRNQKLPTWNLHSNSSVIDFIFCDTISHYKVDDLEQLYVNHHWTDHNLLGISFQYDDPTRRGPGAWKANPFLANSKTFRSALAQHLIQTQPEFEASTSTSSPQQTWDWMKDNVKTFIKSYQRADNNWRAKELKRLQSKRNKMLRQSKNRGLYFSILETINVQIGGLQESIAEIQALKAGKTWREKGEKFAGYIQRTADTQLSQRTIDALFDPTTSTIHTDQENKIRIAQTFYTRLFSPDTVEPHVIEEALSSIPRELRLSTDDCELLTTEIDILDILEVLKKSPKKSSPGSDGLPFEILNLVMRFPPYQELIVTIFNDALNRAIFPESWNKSIMTLLKKKGDSKDMGNYRPLSLANCDYKDPQCKNDGAENGLRCQVIMEDAERKWHSAAQNDSLTTLDRDIGLLLDQEKAYDRINLSYFRAVLRRFGFPQSIVECLYSLMAHNRIQININGFFSEDVAKLRGFKQGDPISCICYDLAFEPFLQSILQDNDFQGYQFTSNKPTSSLPVITTKILCYADDALVFVHDKQDLRLLAYYMDLFCRASNARFNYSKVEAFSISGRDTRSFWSRSLAAMNINHLQISTDPHPLIYLGFPLIQSTLQRNTFVRSFISKLKQTTISHSCRSLSIVGRATVVNTLLLSKCWYFFRVTPLSSQELNQIKSVAIQFLKRGIFPVIPWSTWTLPRSKGGLGILDVQLQYAALYYRWISPLLDLESPTDNSNPLRAMLAIHISNHNNSEHHQLPLLLPVARKQLTRAGRVSTITMLYKSIDMLPRDFDRVTISPHTGLILPLPTIIYTTNPTLHKLPRKFYSMFVSDVFQLHPTLHF
ncbi:hypothetical protein, partial, partial [Parasitella parasitica]